ncbi:MAG: hypothetical protein AB2421_19390 [Thermotaleaceae bacterium]
MERLIIEIDQKPNRAVEEISCFGKVEKISVFLNLFTLQTSPDNIDKIKLINGVKSVRVDEEGYLQVAAF